MTVPELLVRLAAANTTDTVDDLVRRWRLWYDTPDWVAIVTTAPLLSDTLLPNILAHDQAPRELARRAEILTATQRERLLGWALDQCAGRERRSLGESTLYALAMEDAIDIAGPGFARLLGILRTPPADGDPATTERTTRYVQAAQALLLLVALPEPVLLELVARQDDAFRDLPARVVIHPRATLAVWRAALALNDEAVAERVAGLEAATQDPGVRAALARWTATSPAVCQGILRQATGDEFRRTVTTLVQAHPMMATRILADLPVAQRRQVTTADLEPLFAGGTQEDRLRALDLLSEVAPPEERHTAATVPPTMRLPRRVR